MFSIEIKYALQIISELKRARSEGRQITMADVRRKCGKEVLIFNKIMLYLNRNGWVDNEECPTLLVDVEGKSLLNLAEAIGDSAINEHNYIYGWSSDSLREMSVVVDISRQLCDEYRDRLRGMPLKSLIGDSPDVARNRGRKRIMREGKNLVKDSFSSKKAEQGAARIL